jgi:archaellum component FlaC
MNQQTIYSYNNNAYILADAASGNGIAINSKGFITLDKMRDLIDFRDQNSDKLKANGIKIVTRGKNKTVLNLVGVSDSETEQTLAIETTDQPATTERELDIFDDAGSEFDIFHYDEPDLDDEPAPASIADDEYTDYDGDEDCYDDDEDCYIKHDEYEHNEDGDFALCDNSSLNDRLDRIEKMIRDNYDKTDKRIKDISGRLEKAVERIDHRIDKIEREIEGINSRVEILSRAINRLDDDLLIQGAVVICETQAEIEGHKEDIVKVLKQIKETVGDIAERAPIKGTACYEGECTTVATEPEPIRLLPYHINQETHSMQEPVPINNVRKQQFYTTIGDFIALDRIAIKQLERQVKEQHYLLEQATKEIARLKSDVAASGTNINEFKSDVNSTAAALEVKQLKKLLEEQAKLLEEKDRKISVLTKENNELKDESAILYTTLEEQERMITALSRNRGSLSDDDEEEAFMMMSMNIDDHYDDSMQSMFF